jgi:hypothetical protein
MRATYVSTRMNECKQRLNKMKKKFPGCTKLKFLFSFFGKVQIFCMHTKGD